LLRRHIFAIERRFAAALISLFDIAATCYISFDADAAIFTPMLLYSHVTACRRLLYAFITLYAVAYEGHYYREIDGFSPSPAAPPPSFMLPFAMLP